MNKTRYTIYWISAGFAAYEDTDDLSYALAKMQQLRNMPDHRSVTMCSENVDMVGKVGADGVSNGILPSGEKYDWTKNDRVGAAFRNKPPVVGTDSIEVDLSDD